MSFSQHQSRKKCKKTTSLPLTKTVPLLLNAQNTAEYHKVRLFFVPEITVAEAIFPTA